MFEKQMLVNLQSCQLGHLAWPFVIFIILVVTCHLGYLGHLAPLAAD